MMSSTRDWNGEKSWKGNPTEGNLKRSIIMGNGFRFLKHHDCRSEILKKVEWKN